MSASLPWPLFLAWILFTGFLATHSQHAMSFRGRSQVVLLLLHISTAAGCLVTLGLVIYYFTVVAWYWPIVLFVVGSIVGGILFSILGVVTGQLTMTMLAFLGWPAAAVWVFYIMQGLHP